RYLQKTARDEVTAAATIAVPAVAAVPPHADAVALVPIDDALADCIDRSGDLVPGHARKRNAGPEVLDGDRVAVTDSAGLDADAYVARGDLGEFELKNL